MIINMMPLEEHYSSSTEDPNSSSSRRRKRSAPKRIELEGFINSDKKMAKDVTTEERSATIPKVEPHGQQSDSLLSNVSSQMLGMGLAGATELKIYAEKLKQQSMTVGASMDTNGIPAHLLQLANSALLQQQCNGGNNIALNAALLNSLNAGATNDNNNNLGAGVGSTVSLAALLQVLQMLQQQQQHQQLANVLANLPFNGLFGNSSIPTPTSQTSSYNHHNSLAAGLIGNNNNLTSSSSSDQSNLSGDLSSLIRFLPLPSPNLPSYPLLYAQYMAICNQFQNLVQLISQYTASVHQAVSNYSVSNPVVSCSAPLSVVSTPIVDQRHVTNIQPAHSNNSHTSISLQDKLSPSSSGSQSMPSSLLERRESLVSPCSPLSSDRITANGSMNFSAIPPSSQHSPSHLTDHARAWQTPSKKSSSSMNSSKRQLLTSNGTPIKKTTFRGTSEAENQVDPNFKDIDQGNGFILLSERYPSVVINHDSYSSIMSKSSKSATRIIRLLMKHFFTQDELAASSLSGEGIYKKRLDPEVTEAIKSFIRRRHPNLKNGSISLCMTDVCVQARRVANNQRSRSRPSSTLPSSPTTPGAASRLLSREADDTMEEGYDSPSPLALVTGDGEETDMASFLSSQRPLVIASDPEDKGEYTDENVNGANQSEPSL